MGLFYKIIFYVAVPFTALDLVAYPLIVLRLSWYCSRRRWLL